MNAVCMRLALAASSLCSEKVTCGLKCAAAAGESRLAFDLLQVEQAFRLPKRVVFAAAPKTAERDHSISESSRIFPVTFFATLRCLLGVFFVFLFFFSH